MYFTAFQETSCHMAFLVIVVGIVLSLFIFPLEHLKSAPGRLFRPSEWQEPQWACASGVLLAATVFFLLGPSLVNWVNGISPPRPF